MEATASMEATGCAVSCWCATRKSAAPNCPASCYTASGNAASFKAGASCEATGCEAWTACETTPTVEAGTAIPTPRMRAVEPRSGADEHATDEPIRAVVAIGRAGVRVIIVVAVSADGRDAYTHRADAYADHHALSAGIRSCNCENSENCDDSEYL